MQACKSSAYSTPSLKQNREKYIIIIINWCLSVSSRWLFGCWRFILQNGLFLKIEAEMKQSSKWHQRDAKQKVSYQGSRFKALCGNANTRIVHVCAAVAFALEINLYSLHISTSAKPSKHPHILGVQCQQSVSLSELATACIFASKISWTEISVWLSGAVHSPNTGCLSRLERGRRKLLNPWSFTS